MDIIDKAKATWVTAPQFAKIIGASRQAVSKAIDEGRIDYSVRARQCFERKRYLINIYHGLIEWDANTDPGRPDAKKFDLYNILSNLSV
jgi:hypothetical protein